MDREKIGLAIIINNIHFEQPQTQNDVKNLEETFKKIGIEVKQPFLDQSRRELEELADVLASSDFCAYNTIFLVIISYGRAGDLIVCQDNKNFDMNFFEERLCQNISLAGQPKILLCDFCSGEEIEWSKTKSTKLTRIPYGSDVFIGHATTNGYVSLTLSKNSPFIKAFCDQIQESHTSIPFQWIFQRGQQKVSERL